jgi:WD40 repeat protein
MIQLGAESREANQLVFSANGGTLAVLLPDGRTALYDRPWTGPPRVLPGTETIVSVSFNPEGNQLLRYDRKGELTYWDVAGGARERAQVVPPLPPFASAVFSRDTRTLLGCYPGGWWAWDLVHNREILRRETRQHWDFPALTVAPDDRTVAVALESGPIRLWDLASGRDLGQLTGHTGLVHGLAFSSDGALLASGGADVTARVWDWRRGAARLVFRGPWAGRDSVAFSPEGRVLAWHRGDYGLSLMDVTSPEGADSLCPDFSAAGPVAFSPNGRSLGVADRDGTIAVLGEGPANSGELLLWRAKKR